MFLDPEKPKLPCVIYLDDIAIFGDTKEEVLTYTAEAMKRLAEAGFMINLKKSTLCGQEQRILGHHWYSGGYWTPEPKKLESLMKMSDEQLQKCNRASLYGLLNFYREYVPNFAEITEPIRELLGSDSKPWTNKATEAVKMTLQKILNGPRWLNFDPASEIRMETRLSPGGIAAVLL